MPNHRARTPTFTFSRFIPVPESRSALVAVQYLAAGASTGWPGRLTNPLFLHGPPGTGKTHLARALAWEVSRHASQLSIAIIPASDLSAADDVSLTADLLVLEDLQHLPPAAVDLLTHALDHRLAFGLPTIVTAAVGPSQLPATSTRLWSRLVAGLVVRLDALSMESRLAILHDCAQRRQLLVTPDALDWLAEHLTGGSRQLLTALDQLEALARSQPGPLDKPAVARYFQARTEASRPDIATIVQRVSSYFQVNPMLLRSPCRQRHVLVPRQVAMYLARRLTRLSLEEIGYYFGGRDHTTVLHGCRKIEQALARDAKLSGSVQVLRGELT